MEEERKKKTSINTLNSPLSPRICACGCGQEFAPKRRDQYHVNSNHTNHAYNQGARKRASKNQIAAEKQLRKNDKLLDKFYKAFEENEAIVFSLNLNIEGFNHSYFIGFELIGGELQYKSYNYFFSEYKKEGKKLTRITKQKTKVYVKR